MSKCGNSFCPERPRSGRCAAALGPVWRAGALERNGITMLAAVLAEERTNPELLRVFRRHVIRPRRENLRRILRAGKASGQLDPDADIELGISMLVGSLYAAYSAGRRPGREWATQVVDAWLRPNGSACS